MWSIKKILNETTFLKIKIELYSTSKFMKAML